MFLAIVLIATVDDTMVAVPACQVSCGRCGAPLGHEFLGDGPRGKSRF